MKPTSALAFALVLLLVTPRTSAAAEDDGATHSVMLVRPDVLAPNSAQLPLFGIEPAAARSALFAPVPTEVRLSRGAKTAIIVTAIVVGVLLVVGVVAVTRPGHL